MSPEILIAFIAACILLGLTPGPNMSLILASTLTSGLRAGLTTVAGTTRGLAPLVGAATAGMSSVMVLMSGWFDVLRWIGALYLVCLGGLLAPAAAQDYPARTVKIIVPFGAGG